jgi:hypothetical protein
LFTGNADSALQNRVFLVFELSEVVQRLVAYRSQQVCLEGTGDLDFLSIPPQVKEHIIYYLLGYLAALNEFMRVVA